MSDTTDASSFFAALNNIEREMHAGAVKAVAHTAEVVMTNSQQLVPVSPTDPGHPLYIGTSGSLRDSGTVGDVQRDGKEVFVELGYHTGPTAKDNADYAAAVHERLDLNHQYPGAVNPQAQAKFLSIPLMDAKDTLLKLGAKYCGEALHVKQIRVKEFVDALTDYVRLTADVPEASMFAHELIEDHDQGVTTVVAHFGGDLSDTTTEVVIGVQVKSRANTIAGSLARSELLLSVFRDSRGLSISNVELPSSGDRPAFKLMSISDLKPPTPLGRNPADKKYESVFNCIATYHVVMPTP